MEIQWTAMMATKRNRLKVLRAERDLSQMDLAVKVGMGRDRYMRIERGFTEPTATERRAFAKVLRVRDEDLGFPAPTASPSSAEAHA
jgi:transcriptional regulator with XRE-family HTH domain